jgi:hypothetical protein
LSDACCVAAFPFPPVGVPAVSFSFSLLAIATILLVQPRCGPF